MREYTTGATRSDVAGRPQYEGYFSPIVLWRFGQYMLKHQKQEDGKMRKADNWQQGMPLDDYMDSMWRHFMDIWLYHRGHGVETAHEELQDALCAMMFNVMGYLHENIVRGD